MSDRLSDEQIEKMIQEILEYVDHDIAKNYRRETAEEFLDADMEELIVIVRNHVD